MRPSLVLAASVLVLVQAGAIELKQREKAGCGDGIIRGVNTGGWFVMEPWITPKVFEEVNVGDLADKIIDEWTYAEFLDPADYQQKMIKHWSTFYTREDFVKLQAVGISHVRVPIAYWFWDVMEGEPFPTPNMDDTDENSPLFYLKQGLMWMDELGLKVNIDLHTGPGSQNGYDNSGHAGEIHWVDNDYPHDRFNIDRTVDILGQIFETLQGWLDQGVMKEETLWGIGILNEPHICGWYEGGRFWPACRDDFYPLGYNKVREFFPADKVTVNLDQAAKGYGEFAGYFDPPEFVNIHMDSHVYQCFGGYWNEVANAADGWNTHLSQSCNFKNEIMASPLSTYVGEFSMSVTECTKYLKGYFTPYNPPDFDDAICEYYNNDWSTYSDDYKEFIGNFFLAQIDGFEAGAGWFMWTAKTQDNAAPEWDFLFLVEQGVIPQDLCTRPTYC